MDHRSIMSGQRRDPLAIAFRAALRLASIPYGFAIFLRNRRYDRGSKEIYQFDVPVICVGNLTTGGTGKTPIVCHLANWFRQRDLRVAIVSRGYGRGQVDFNDEAMELHAKLPDVPHVQDPDRVKAARVAVDELETQVILMDDGFQHRRLHRDLNLVVIDVTCPFGFGYLLPRGLLREPIKNLRRADLIVLTRCHSVSESKIVEIENVVHAIQPELPILRSDHEPTSLLEYPGTRLPMDLIKQKTVAAVSAIGNPEAFERTIEDCGAAIGDAIRLPDHDEYAPSTVQRLREWARGLSSEVEVILCTHKDLVKLQTDRLGGKRLAALQIELRLHSGTGALESQLMAIENQVKKNAAVRN